MNLWLLQLRAYATVCRLIHVKLELAGLRCLRLDPKDERAAGNEGGIARSKKIIDIECLSLREISVQIFG